MIPKQVVLIGALWYLAYVTHRADRRYSEHRSLRAILAMTCLVSVSLFGAVALSYRQVPPATKNTPQNWSPKNI